MMIPSTFRSTSSRLASQTRINATQHRLASSYCLAAIAGDGIGHEVVPVRYSFFFACAPRNREKSEIELGRSKSVATCERG